MSLSSELCLISSCDVAHLTVSPGLNIKRSSNLIPHVSRSHQQDHDLYIFVRVSLSVYEEVKGERFTIVIPAQM